VTLDPQAKMLLDYLAQSGVRDVATCSVQEAREMRETRKLPPGPPAHVEDRSIEVPHGKVPVRIYRPLTGDCIGGLVFFHGGGFVLGDLEGHDAVCRQLSVDAACTVVSVDYRLAPEHKFPGAVDDCFAATQWVHAHAQELGFDPGRLAVGGDSAGATLAAVVAQLAKAERSPPIVFQLLIYPVADIRSFDTPSYIENASGYFLTRDGMRWFAEHYIRNDSDRDDPRCSLLASTNVAALPAALIVTAEHDPLRDEGEAYGELLRSAGNQVTISRYPGMIHAFVSLYAILDAGRDALRECTTALRAALGGVCDADVD
jgi:acetyl esterase